MMAVSAKAMLSFLTKVRDESLVVWRCAQCVSIGQQLQLGQAAKRGNLCAAIQERL
jgi:hypothetical protein